MGQGSNKPHAIEMLSDSNPWGFVSGGAADKAGGVVLNFTLGLDCYSSELFDYDSFSTISAPVATQSFVLRVVLDTLVEQKFLPSPRCCKVPLVERPRNS